MLEEFIRSMERMPVSHNLGKIISLTHKSLPATKLSRV